MMLDLCYHRQKVLTIDNPSSLTDKLLPDKAPHTHIDSQQTRYRCSEDNSYYKRKYVRELMYFLLQFLRIIFDEILFSD